MNDQNHSVMLLMIEMMLLCVIICDLLQREPILFFFTVVLLEKQLILVQLVLGISIEKTLGFHFVLYSTFFCSAFILSINFFVVAFVLNPFSFLSSSFVAFSAFGRDWNK